MEALLDVSERNRRSAFRFTPANLTRRPLGDRSVPHVLNLLRSAGFDSETVRIICEAYVSARKPLNDVRKPDRVNEIIALRILSLAKKGERDPDRLRRGALAALPSMFAFGPAFGAKADVASP
jgi:hypothetical protein